MNNITKTLHALKVLESLDELRSDQTICDFTIRVRNESFAVHRAVLAACSKYFQAMFTSNMKEAQEGIAHMIDVEADAVKQCIEFIYTGEATVTVDNAISVLQVSDMMQIDDLSEFAARELQKNLTVENCVLIDKIAEMYRCDDLRIWAKQCAVNNFEAFIATEGFLQLSKSDLLKYLDPSLRPELLWDGVLEWAQFDASTRKQHLFELMVNIKVSGFPWSFLLEKACDESFMKAYQDCGNMVLNALFADLDELESNLDRDNYFVVRKLSKNYQNPDGDQIKEIFDEYAKTHGVEALIEDEEFCDLETEDVLSLFRCCKHSFFFEAEKWEGMLKWVKREPERKGIFPELLKTINFQSLSVEYIVNTILKEKIVNESPECTEIVTAELNTKLLLQAFETRNEVPDTAQEAEDESYIAVLDQNAGEINGFSVSYNCWRSLADVPKKHRFTKMVGLKGRLYLFIGRDLFLLRNNGTWEEKESMDINPDNNTQIVAFRNCINVVGAHHHAYYMPSQDSWTWAGDTEFGTGFCIAASEDSIYAIGGHVLKKDPKRLRLRGRGSGNGWVDIASMIRRRDFCSASFLDDKVYAVGGFWDGEALDSAEVFDIDANAWTEIYEPMNFARRRFSTCVVDERLFAVGGAFDGDGTTRDDEDSIELYDEIDGEWRVVFYFDVYDLPLNACAIEFSN